MAKLTDKLVIAAIIKANGNVSAAARKLGVCRAAVTKRMAKNPAIGEAVTDAIESLIDDAVSVIGHHIKKKSLPAAKHVTETLGRSRGWVRTEDVRAEFAALLSELAKLRSEYAELQRANQASNPGSGGASGGDSLPPGGDPEAQGGDGRAAS